MTRALVIGGTGFVGQAACRELMRRGVETVAAGRTAHPYGTFTSHRGLDKSQPEELEQVLAAVAPDVLLDLAPGPPAAAAVARRAVLRCAPLAEPGLVAVHTPAVMGPGDPSLRIAAYIQRVEDGGPLLVPEETYRQPLGLAWVRDAGYACALACDLARPAAGGPFAIAFARVTVEDLVAGIGRALGRAPQLVPVPAAELPAGASPYAPAELDLEATRAGLGFEASALEDALAETLAWYRVRRPTHPGYAGRARELALAAERGRA